MKKLTIVLVTLAMVFGAAAMAAAECVNCAGDNPGRIARGCSSDQGAVCAPFDYENQYCYYPNDSSNEVCNSYCDKADDNRAIFKICDCVPEIWTTFSPGDTADISMEILVDSGNGKETGDNGVYWAENIDSTNGIPAGLYPDQARACADEGGYDNAFMGVYEYLLADGKTIGAPNTSSNDCTLDKLERVVKLQLDYEVESNSLDGVDINGNAWHGLVIPNLNSKSTLAIDIPYMRVDNSMINSGDKVWVKICLSIGSDCAPCCCEIFIGTLCCYGDSAAATGLVYPYFPPANSTAFNLLGMTLSNLDSSAGTATVTLYEADGDVGQLTGLSVAAKGTYLTTLGDLVAALTKTAGAGTLGDSKGYITVEPEFNATGFAMIADTVDGASMGYLPINVQK